MAARGDDSIRGGGEVPIHRFELIRPAVAGIGRQHAADRIVIDDDARVSSGPVNRRRIPAGQRSSPFMLARAAAFTRSRCDQLHPGADPEDGTSTDQTSPAGSTAKWVLGAWMVSAMVLYIRRPVSIGMGVKPGFTSGRDGRHSRLRAGRARALQ